jgi:aminotransferase EvaB
LPRRIIPGAGTEFNAFDNATRDRGPLRYNRRHVIALHDLRRLHEPYLADLREALDGALDAGWFVLGERCLRFESDFAAWCGVDHALGVANGTDAIEIALRAAGVGSGDAVVTVANAGGYASTAILACDALPHYVDVDPVTMNADLDALPAALARRPRAMVLTHLYGRMAPAKAIAERCAESRTLLIEDCAQAHGARADGNAAGTFGSLGCFSFYPTKNLGALGDGGAIVTRDERLAGRVRRLRQYGWDGKYHVTESGGCNSRLDEIQAAVLAVKLRHVDAENARRRAIAARYSARIMNPAIEIPRRGGESDVVHLFVVRTHARDALAAHLAAEGIQTDIHYPLPDHRQPAHAARFGDVALPVTERLAGEILSLPCHPGLTDEEVSHVVAACAGFRA